MELLIAALVIGLIVFGLERNKNRGAALVGSSDIHDRDQERLSSELFRA